MDKIWDRKSFEARDHYDSYIILHSGEINKTKHVDYQQTNTADTIFANLYNH